MDKTTQDITVKLRDRVTFDTDEGIQAGYVNDLRRDLGNGELHAWVELEHHLPGCFRAVRVSDILTSDQVGPPSTCYIGFDWATHAACLNTPLVIDEAADRRERAENEPRFQCPACGHVGAVESQFSNYCQNDRCRRISPRHTQSHIADANPLVTVEATVDRLARAESALLTYGFTDCDGKAWLPPVAYRPIEIFDMVKLDDAHQSGLDDARSGEHELFPDESCPLDGIEGDKPFCRFHFYADKGDPSVGEPGRAYWALSADQSGTELAQLLAATPPVLTYERAVEFADKNAVLVENAYIGYTGEHIDHGAAYAIAEAMAAAHI
ncbi:hypothetical protein [Collimonas sp.]|uniref:hypothetical protein n=1 Tax=Collimonas sp. TaxID=1963772 RepID=UPI002BD4FBCE|nr:hypothetical protein [Collimonas sp.]HWX02239.1 hypothetical protein [Collimonas sp.]